MIKKTEATMRQILICSPSEKPRQALAGEIRVLNIASEVVETGDFADIPEYLNTERFSAIVADEPTTEQRTLLSAVCGGTPLFYLTREPFAADNAQTFQKPFRLSVFLTALIAAAAQFEQSDDAAFYLGNWKFNFAAKTLTFKDAEIKLTEKEADLLNYLHRRDAPVDRETLLRDIWGYGAGVSTHTLETHIYRLRQKLEKTGITFLAGANDGYRLVCSPERQYAP